MAQAMVEVMEQLGHVHFALAGHDRGGRVAYRLALDHPGRLSRLAVLDILPTYDYWERMNRLYALKIYHWTFLAQPFPLPETLIGGHPDFFLRQKMASQTKSKNLDAIDPRALEHYLAPFRDPSRVHAMCEDYRAGAYADYEIDKADFEAGKKITIPMLALWGDAGIASAAATPLDIWKQWATNVSGAAGRFRSLLARGKSGCDGEGVEGVFCGCGIKRSPKSCAMAARYRLAEKLPQQSRRLALADRGIDLRRVMAGRRRKEPHAGLDRAALGVGRAVIEPPDPRQRDRARAHRARLQRDIEVAIDQPLAADDCARLRGWRGSRHARSGRGRSACGFRPWR